MKDILTDIIDNKRIEIQAFKEYVNYEFLEQQVAPMLSCQLPSMRQNLLNSHSGIIAEFKRKSPSKGWINENGAADVIPMEYEKAGASAISILTDYKYFGGEDKFIAMARHSGVTAPILYKNFIIDEYQLLQARLCGASAVLLIAACLTKDECRGLIAKAHSLGMEVLLEMHKEEELDYAELSPDMYGVNNRNLGTFITDVQNSYRLSEKLPSDVCKVSESGISDPKTIAELRKVGFNGFLIGECFMKETNPGLALRNFINNI